MLRGLTWLQERATLAPHGVRMIQHESKVARQLQDGPTSAQHSRDFVPGWSKRDLQGISRGT
eukprot:9252860-Karenia_brevis.AAC.1